MTFFLILAVCILLISCYQSTKFRHIKNEDSNEDIYSNAIVDLSIFDGNLSIGLINKYKLIDRIDKLGYKKIFMRDDELIGNNKQKYRLPYNNNDINVNTFSLTNRQINSPKDDSNDGVPDIENVDEEAIQILNDIHIDMKSSNCIRNGTYCLKDQIFKGGHGEIFRAYLLDKDGLINRNISYILKRMQILNKYHIQQAAEREIYYGRLLKGMPNMPRFVTHFATATDYWLVYRDEGISLQQLFYAMTVDSTSVMLKPSKVWRKFRQTEIGRSSMRTLLNQIIRHVSELHKIGIIHRDLKPSNILLNTEIQGQPHLVINDFSSAMCDGSIRLLLFDHIGPTQSELTLDYAAPEVRLSSDPSFSFDLEYPESYDIFSIGVIFLEILLGTNQVFDVMDQRTIAMVEHRLKSKRNDPNYEQIREQTLLLTALADYGIFRPTDSSRSTNNNDSGGIRNNRSYNNKPLSVENIQTEIASDVILSELHHHEQHNHHRRHHQTPHHGLASSVDDTIDGNSRNNDIDEFSATAVITTSSFSSGDDTDVDTSMISNSNHISKLLHTFIQPTVKIDKQHHLSNSHYHQQEHSTSSCLHLPTSTDTSSDSSDSGDNLVAMNNCDEDTHYSNSGERQRGNTTSRNHYQLQQAILRRDILGLGYSDEWGLDLLSRLLAWEPSQRIPLIEALEHAYFRGAYKSDLDGSEHATAYDLQVYDMNLVRRNPGMKLERIKSKHVKVTSIITHNYDERYSIDTGSRRLSVEDIAEGSDDDEDDNESLSSTNNNLDDTLTIYDDDNDNSDNATTTTTTTTTTIDDIIYEKNHMSAWLESLSSSDRTTHYHLNGNTSNINNTDNLSLVSEDTSANSAAAFSTSDTFDISFSCPHCSRHFSNYETCSTHMKYRKHGIRCLSHYNLTTPTIGDSTSTGRSKSKSQSTTSRSKFNSRLLSSSPLACLSEHILQPVDYDSGWCDLKGRRKYMEDMHSLAHEEEYSYYAVHDGHFGSRAARFTSRHHHNIFRAALIDLSNQTYHVMCNSKKGVENDDDNGFNCSERLSSDIGATTYANYNTAEVNGSNINDQKDTKTYFTELRKNSAKILAAVNINDGMRADWQSVARIVANKDEILFQSYKNYVRDGGDNNYVDTTNNSTENAVVPMSLQLETTAVSSIEILAIDDGISNTIDVNRLSYMDDDIGSRSFNSLLSRNEKSNVDCSDTNSINSNHEINIITAHDVARALEYSYLETDRQFLLTAGKTEKSGTTTAAVLLFPHHIAVGNVGDSRVILCCDEEGYPIQLTQDHTPYVLAESQRVEAAGGTIYNSPHNSQHPDSIRTASSDDDTLERSGRSHVNEVGKSSNKLPQQQKQQGPLARVNGILAVTRSIGDFRLKPFITAQPDILIIHRDNHNNYNSNSPSSIDQNSIEFANNYVESTKRLLPLSVAHNFTNENDTNQSSKNNTDDGDETESPLSSTSISIESSSTSTIGIHLKNNKGERYKNMKKAIGGSNSCRLYRDYIHSLKFNSDTLSMDHLSSKKEQSVNDKKVSSMNNINQNVTNSNSIGTNTTEVDININNNNTFPNQNYDQHYLQNHLFLIIASDGLYDTVINLDAVDIVCQHLLTSMLELNSSHTKNHTNNNGEDFVNSDVTGNRSRKLDEDNNDIIDDKFKSLTLSPSTLTATRQNVGNHGNKSHKNRSSINNDDFHKSQSSSSSSSTSYDMLFHDAATLLSREAYLRGSSDNIGTCVINLFDL